MVEIEIKNDAASLKHLNFKLNIMTTLRPTTNTCKKNLIF